MPVPQAAAIARQAATLLVAAAGGWIAARLSVPLAWMIGSMLAVATVSLAGMRVATLEMARPGALIVLGTALGQSFTPPVLAALADSLPALLVGGLGAILAGVIAGRATARIAGTDPRTSYYASVPGGIVVMVVLAARAGASVPVVTLSQTLRMMLVVLVYPPLLVAFAERGRDVFSLVPVPVAWPLLPVLLAASLAGAAILRRTGLANPWMMGPVLVSLCLAVAGTPLSGVPSVFIDVAQLLMGWTLGTRLDRSVILRSPRLALAAALSMAIVSLLCAAIALSLSHAAALPLAAVLLGTAPGGMPEMAITAKVLDLGVPLVLAFHLVRVALCSLLVGPIDRLRERLEARRDPPRNRAD